MKRFLWVLILARSLCASMTLADTLQSLKPSPKDKCSVCGMFVAQYPDFLAQVLFKDGSHAFFDGAKDMFKYTLDLSRYNPKKQASDIAAIYVTDYYRLVPIDGYKSFYVIGSDVNGPMGSELIPFEKEEDARAFLADHAGKAIRSFKDIDRSVIKRLD